MNDEIPSILIATVSFVVVAFVGFGLGSTVQRKKAVDAGVAEYQVDSKTGSTTFVYVTNYNNLTNK